jgi:hypothetical protein
MRLMMAAALFSASLVALMASATGVAASRDLLQGCTTLDAPFTNLIRTGDTVVGTNEFGLGMHIDEKYQRIHVTISEVGRNPVMISLSAYGTAMFGALSKNSPGAY